jgi:hypothetical protein
MIYEISRFARTRIFCKPCHVSISMRRSTPPEIYKAVAEIESPSDSALRLSYLDEL